jgi:hypothetical protein
LLSDEQDLSLFASKGPDYEQFIESKTPQWKAIFEPLYDLVLQDKSQLKAAIFISGPALLWLQKHCTELSALLQKLHKTQRIHWVAGPLDHSLRFIYHRSSLRDQFSQMKDLLGRYFGQQARTAAMPGLFYNTYFGYLANQFEIDTLLVPTKGDTLLSHVPHNLKLRLLHTKAWSVSMNTQQDQALLVPLDMNAPSQFFTWLTDKLNQNQWLWPHELLPEAETQPWDVQESIAHTAHLGRNLEALEHAYCKNWISHLKELAETGKGGSALHYAVLFEALLGKVPDHQPLEVYRTLLMHPKLAY